MFDGTLGDWYIYLIDIELNIYYKPLNCKYYTGPRIDKDTFHKELQSLVKIGLLTVIQYYQFSTPLFIIPKK